MIAIELSPKVVQPGDVMSIRITPHEHAGFFPPNGQVELRAHLIKLEREAFAFGLIGAQTSSNNGAVVVEWKVPDKIEPGVYSLADIVVHSESRQNLSLYRNGLIAEQFFAVRLATSAGDEASPEAQAVNLRGKREEWLKSEIKLSGKPGANTYQCIVFGVGCNVDAPQHVKGISVFPLNGALSYDSALNAVNSFLEPHFKMILPKDPKTEQEYGTSHPVIATVFHRIVADDADQAAQYAAEITEMIFSIIAVDRGRKASVFAFVCIGSGGGYGFPSPLYRGNLASPMFGNLLAELVERYLPLARRSDWTKFILSLFGQANAEQEPIWQFFHYWSVLEVAAAKRVSPNVPLAYPSGAPIENRGRQIVTGERHGRANVYKYLRDLNAADSYSANGHNYDLWDVVSGFSMIRNKIAHEGRFTPYVAATLSRDETLANELAATSIITIHMLGIMVLWSELQKG